MFIVIFCLFVYFQLIWFKDPLCSLSHEELWYVLKKNKFHTEFIRSIFFHCPDRLSPKHLGKSDHESELFLSVWEDISLPESLSHRLCEWVHRISSLPPALAMAGVKGKLILFCSLFLLFSSYANFSPSCLSWFTKLHLLLDVCLPQHLSIRSAVSFHRNLLRPFVAGFCRAAWLDYWRLAIAGFVLG